MMASLYQGMSLHVDNQHVYLHFHTTLLEIQQPGESCSNTLTVRDRQFDCGIGYGRLPDGFQDVVG